MYTAVGAGALRANATVLKKGSATVISAGGDNAGSIALSDSGAVNLIDNGAHDLYWYMDVDIPVSNVANIGIKLMTDGTVDILDLVRVKKYAAGIQTEICEAADLDGNLAINAEDLIQLRKILLKK